MSLNINVTCDAEGCDKVIPCGFDSYDETLEQLMEMVYDAGWLVQGPAREPRVLCDTHTEEA